MKTYIKPMVVTVNDMSEGVYTASGGCYTATARIVQKPETGRETYVIQVDALHNGDHETNAQLLTIKFNQAVTYVSCYANGASYESGNGTDTLNISLTYHNNPTENIGFGDLSVTSENGLAIEECTMTDIGIVQK